MNTPNPVPLILYTIPQVKQSARENGKPLR